MTNYREILRLQSLGMNKQETAASVGCSRNTVAEVLRRAKEKGLKYLYIPLRLPQLHGHFAHHCR